MPTHTVTAVNTSPDSGNRIHGDDVAADLGFRGGLVPGVDVWAYLARPAIDTWGEAFLAGGAMTGRFAAPVYDGEPVTVTMDADGALSLAGPDGECATGSASVPAEPRPPFDLPAGEHSDRPPASREHLAVGTALMPFHMVYDRAKGQAYVDLVGEADSLPATLGCAHPALLLRPVNWVLSYHVQLGPWIHVSSDVQHHRLVRHGDHLEYRGVVTGLFERGGHEFVDFDCAVLADGEPAMSVKHRAIWQLRGAAAT